MSCFFVVYFYVACYIIFTMGIFYFLFSSLWYKTTLNISTNVGCKQTMTQISQFFSLAFKDLWTHLILLCWVDTWIGIECGKTKKPHGRWPALLVVFAILRTVLRHTIAAYLCKLIFSHHPRAGTNHSERSSLPKSIYHYSLHKKFRELTLKNSSCNLLVYKGATVD